MERRVTVKEAAGILGISPEAVRARIKRGTLHKEKDQDGTVYVRLDGDGTGDGTHYAHQGRDELVAQLRAEVEAWREESRRKDHIIAALVQRVPELEAARDETQAPEPSGSGDVPPEPEEAAQPRSWWRRFFGFE